MNAVRQGRHDAHSTKYETWTDERFYGEFRGQSWFPKGEDERRELLQEAVNRSARERGEIGSCAVVFADLDVRCAGQQSGELIELNREMFVHDRQIRNYNGRVLCNPLADSNMRALETVFHEDLHAFQNQVIRGLIPETAPGMREEYAANHFTRLPITLPNGQTAIGSSYLNGETPVVGYYLYYFQSTERDAHRLSENQTVRIMDALALRYGEEASFSAYRQELASNGYEAVTAEARKLFGDVDLNREVNQSLMNHYYHTNQDVDATIESLVVSEMYASYQAQVHQNQASPTGATRAPHGTREGNHMAINWHVSRETYNQTLRDSVNAYYEHAMRSNEISREDAIRTTAEMAEGYLTEMDAFDAAQAAENAAETATENSAGIDSGGSEADGGMDGGEGGGVE